MSSRLSGFILASISLPLVACASVSVIPLDYAGQPKNEAPGIRYYMPKPYLLVTQIPNDQWPNNTHSTAIPTNSKYAKATASDGDGTGTKDGDATAPASKTASPSPTSDLSYQLGNNTYLLKLVYLPDMSKTMAINIVPGVFGTSSAQPTLQDGWMLTSMQASSDNTKALDDLTSLATALVGGGTQAAKTAATKSLEAGPPTKPDPSLPPGLYEFRYDERGHLIGLCAVTVFSNKTIDYRHPNAGPVTNTGFCPSLESLAALNWIRARG